MSVPTDPPLPPPPPPTPDNDRAGGEVSAEPGIPADKSETSALLKDIIGKLSAGAGSAAAVEGHFSIDSAVAREKMRKYQIAEPRTYVLELVQAAVLKGSTKILFSIDSDDVLMYFNGRPFTPRELEGLFGAALGAAEDRDAQACQELAVGLNTALSLNPIHIFLISGDGHSGTRMELTPENPDHYAPLPVPIRGTALHVKTKEGIRRPGRIVRNLTSTLPEERALRYHCRFCPAELTMDFWILSKGSDARREGGFAPIRADGVSGCIGFHRTDFDFPSVVHLMKNGVIITSATFNWDASLFEAAVESDRVKKDLSRRDVIRDQAFQEAILHAYRLRSAVGPICPRCNHPLHWIYGIFRCVHCRTIGRDFQRWAENHNIDIPLGAGPVCPRCGNWSRYLIDKDRAWCTACNADPCKPLSSRSHPRPPPNPEGPVACPRCGKPTQYLPDHDRDYCWTCEAYAPPRRT